MKKRCPWAEINKKMRAYHDTEWGTPCRDDRVLFEYILLDSFQAGLSWDIILKKRENFGKAFSDFDPVKIARYDKVKISSLLKDTGIVRHRGKIEAAVTNAKTFLAMQKEFGSFTKYMWGFTGGRPVVNRFRSIKELPAVTPLAETIAQDLKARGFKFLGPTVIYAHMQATGMVNDHMTNCFRYQEVQALPSNPR